MSIAVVQSSEYVTNYLRDANNHINFCTGKKLTNGLQGRVVGSGPFCNGIVMGEIPDRSKMVSSLITFPTFGTNIAVGEPFDVLIKVRGLTAGTFTSMLYYIAF